MSSLHETAAAVSDSISYHNSPENNVEMTELGASDDDVEVIVSFEFPGGKHSDPSYGMELDLYKSLVG